MKHFNPVKPQRTVYGPLSKILNYLFMSWGVGIRSFTFNLRYKSNPPISIAKRRTIVGTASKTILKMSVNDISVILTPLLGR